MNERFLFRAWHKIEKRMANTDVFNVPAGLVHADEWVDGGYWWNENDCEIMQCTGLRDKNGKLIFEGDIIRPDKGYYYSEDYIGVVRWSRTRFEWASIPSWIERELFDFDSSHIEIIGNLHDNPELLGGENQ